MSVLACLKPIAVPLFIYSLQPTELDTIKGFPDPPVSSPILDKIPILMV